MADTDRIRRDARRLRNAVEPLAAGIYFAPEAHEAYAGLGFGPSSGDADGVAMPEPAAYFTSRGASLGQVPGEVVAAAFGVFNPAVVVPLVTHGWSLTDRDTILAARLDGATRSLTRILGDDPPGRQQATDLLRRAAEAADGAGRALFSGLWSLGFPGHPIGDLWRAADLVREHRGDSHIGAWLAHDLDPVEIGLLTELWWGLPARSYVRTRAWTPDDLDAATDRLRSRGLLDGDGALTEAGRDLREAVELATDIQEARLLAALGDDLDDLCRLLESWGRQIVDAKGYPGSPAQITRRS